VQLELNYYALLGLEAFEPSESVAYAVNSYLEAIPEDALPPSLAFGLASFLRSIRYDLTPPQKHAYDAALGSTSRRRGVPTSLPPSLAASIPLLMLRNGHAESAASLASLLLPNSSAIYPFCAAHTERASLLRRDNRSVEAASTLASAVRHANDAARSANRNALPRQTHDLLASMHSELDELLRTSSNNSPVLLALLEREGDESVRAEALEHLKQRMRHSETLSRKRKRRRRSRLQMSTGLMDSDAVPATADGPDALSDDASDGVISLDLVRLSLQRMRSYEIASLRNWERVASGRDLGLARWQPAIRIAVHALLAAAVVYKQPHHARSARNVLRNGRSLLEGVPSAMDQSTALFLLGEVSDAQSVLEEDERKVTPTSSSSAGRIAGTYGLMADTPADGVVLATRLPDPSAPWNHPGQPMQYIRDAAPRNNDLVEGMYALMSSWLAEEVLPRFPDTESTEANLEQYFNDSDVIQALDAGDHSLVESATHWLNHLRTRLPSTPSRVSLPQLPQVFAFPQLLSQVLLNRSRRFEKRSSVLLGASLAAAAAAALSGARSSGIAKRLQFPCFSAASTMVLPSHLLGNDSEYRLAPMSWRDAERTVRGWQGAKAKALGKRHEISSLQQWLTGPMLNDWMARADRGKRFKMHWEYSLDGLRVKRVAATRSGLARLDAEISETAALVDDSSGNIRDSYSDTYDVTYWVQRESDGTFKLCSVAVH